MPSLVNIVISVLAIFFFLYGLGQIFFGSILLGVILFVVGSVFVWMVVRRI